MLPVEYPQEGRKWHESSGNPYGRTRSNTPCITPYSTAAQETRVTDHVYEPDSDKLAVFTNTAVSVGAKNGRLTRAMAKRLGF